jgi:hypothetical protein
LYKKKKFMSKPRIIKAQVKRTRSYAESIVDGVSSLTNWVTGAPPLVSDKDIVTSAKFSEIQIGIDPCQPPTPCLIVGYNNGFHIWDISASKVSQDNNIVEIASVQGFRVRDFCVFNRLNENVNMDPRKVERPLLGVISGEDSSHNVWPNTKLQLYSILNHTFLQSIDFLSPIINVLSNNRFVVVIFQNQAILLSPVTFEKQFCVHLYGESPRSGGVADLGSRWLAYQCRQPLEDTMAASRLLSPNSSLPTEEEPKVNETTSSNRRKKSKSYISSSDQVLWTVGSTLVEVTSSIRSISTMWPIKSYMVGYDMRGEQVVVPREESSKDIGGYIMVIDLENPHVVDNSEGDYKNRLRLSRKSNFNVVAHFKASQDSPLSIVRFDPTGTLLATASEKGNIINVYKINPKDNIFESHQHLYVLKRGVTPTIIKQITFSIDSSLVAITSAYKGTTHLYGINLQGGVVDAISHLHINRHRRSELQYSPSYFESVLQAKGSFIEPQYPSKLAVIHSDVQDPTVTEEKDRLFGSVVQFGESSEDDYYLCGLDSSGILTYYRIQLTEGESNKLGLAGNVNGIVEWDLRRPTKSRAYRFQPAIHPQKVVSTSIPERNKHKAWLRNIETNTCTMPHTPFWMANDLLPLQPYTAVPIIVDKDKISDPISQDEIYRTTERAVLPVKESNNKLFSFY